jgi:thiosulfate dehydrogenase [quinone] large subunit
MNIAGILKGAAAEVRSPREVKDIGPLSALLGDRRYALLWLPVRLWLGVVWLQYAWLKLSDPQWMGSGETMKGYLVNATATAGQDWYRAFMQLLIDSGAYVPMAKVVAVGELAVGLGVLFGGLTGLAAVNCVMMNLNYLLSGSMGPDPQMLVAGLGLALGWKVSGYWGADRVLLPAIQVLRDKVGEKLAARAARVPTQRLATGGVSALSVSGLLLYGYMALSSVTGTPATAAVAPVAGDAAVEMGATEFKAKDVAVYAGSRVVFKNTSQVAHTVTSGSQPKADGAFDSGMLKAGEEYVQAFNKAGTYSYYCAFHAGMVGTITVVANAN